MKQLQCFFFAVENALIFEWTCNCISAKKVFPQDQYRNEKVLHPTHELTKSRRFDSNSFST